MCAFELHVGGHHPADVAWEDGLDEQGVDTGGVVAGEDDGAVGREVFKVVGALDAESVDESGVGADKEPTRLPAFACWAFAGGAEDEGDGGDGEERRRRVMATMRR